ncbi:hypothetical protein MUN88_12045 [Gracilibacillus caseinilyticus]|uniref:Sugar ABC transporter permease n=1 Tax=Gracilibacillus caseinilyticus TaxID=2932256 RepID=A0ABY4ERM9_9BACI|nr:hypothetical protein [Gracilibacillus caseinilyticus]UOQ46828.1 hypothetical protein MUN88_12045 [Gracilibacillus caseinilyticus]
MSGLKTPVHLWLVAVIFLFFYVIGLIDYVMSMSLNESYFNSLEYSQQQVTYFSNYPIVLSIIFGINVFGGTVAAVLLFFRNKYAVTLTLVALIAKVLLDLTTFLFMDRYQVFGPQSSLTDLSMILLTLLVYLYSKYMKKKGVLNE